MELSLDRPRCCQFGTERGDVKIRNGRCLRSRNLRERRRLLLHRPGSAAELEAAFPGYAALVDSIPRACSWSPFPLFPLYSGWKTPFTPGAQNLDRTPQRKTIRVEVLCLRSTASEHQGLMKR
jgi:hypothetical protein